MNNNITKEEARKLVELNPEYYKELTAFHDDEGLFWAALTYDSAYWIGGYMSDRLKDDRDIVSAINEKMRFQSEYGEYEPNLVKNRLNKPFDEALKIIREEK